jgi:hypothetical protein
VNPAGSLVRRFSCSFNTINIFIFNNLRSLEHHFHHH